MKGKRQRTIGQGPQTMDYRPWTRDHGPETMDQRPWTTDDGPETMGNGAK
ncbi:MAG: hypothetical protein ABJB16_16895 [Saprospiraceae bacterium]